LREIALAKGFEVLAIAPHHAEAAADLVQHHKDPFDRLLIAQAQLERLELVSVDGFFPAYGVSLVSPLQ
jgi:PIN domain nuclease of toxin-antitoxin system